jgi:hypothetical protein
MRKGRMEYAKVGALKGKFLLSFEEKFVSGANRGWLFVKFGVVSQVN